MGSRRIRAIACIQVLIHFKKMEGNPATADFEATLTIEELAAKQGVCPVEDFNSILGPIDYSDDDSIDFLQTLRQWRQEGGDRTNR